MLRWEEKYFTNYFYSHFKILFSLSPSESSKRIHSIARISSLASIITAKRWDFFSSPPPPPPFLSKVEGSRWYRAARMQIGGKKRKGNENERGWEERRKKGAGNSIDDIYIHATARDGVPGKKGVVRYSITSFRSISKVNWSVVGEGDPWESEI